MGYSNFYNEIGGFNPTVHPSTFDLRTLNVINGKNYRWVNDGLVSGWGNDLIASNSFNYVSYPFQVEDETFILSCGGEVHKLGDPSACSDAELVYTFQTNPNTPPHPWSSIEHNCSYYFVNPCSKGIIRYNLFNKQWTTINIQTELGIDGKLYGILFHDARVWILAEDTVNLSAAIGSPIGLSSSGLPTFKEITVENGAGFWSTKDGGGGKPFGLYKSFDEVYAFLETGIMVFKKPWNYAGQFERNNAPYHMRWEYSKKSALNPWCVLQYDEQEVLFLGQRGLYYFKDNREITDFNKIVSTYFVDHISRYHKTDSNNSIKLWSSPYTDEIFISFDKDNQGYYSTSLVIHTRLEKLSSFDIKHSQLCPVDFKNDDIGFFGVDGKLRIFNNSSHHVASSNGCDVTYEPLNSFVYLGVVGFQQQIDDVTRDLLVNNITVYNSNLIANHTRLNIENTNYEDMYKGKSNYTLKAYASSDKYTLNTDSFQTCIPIRDYENSILYDTFTKGVSIILKIEADKNNQYYSIKNLSVDYVVGGIR